LIGHHNKTAGISCGTLLVNLLKLDVWHLWRQAQETGPRYPIDRDGNQHDPNDPQRDTDPNSAGPNRCSLGAAERILETKPDVSIVRLSPKAIAAIMHANPDAKRASRMRSTKNATRRIFK